MTEALRAVIARDPRLCDAIAEARAATERADWKAVEMLARADEEAVLRAERDRRMRNAGAALDPAIRAAIVCDGFDPYATPAGRAVARWRPHAGRCPVLVLQSDTGVGKSSAACWWLANREGGGHLRSATTIASAWASTTVRAGDERELLCHCEALVVDDVGTELPYQVAAMAAALRELLECRQGLQTIITTNLTRKAWSERYPDKRITSRMARATWIGVHGPDLRRRR